MIGLTMRSRRLLLVESNGKSFALWLPFSVHSALSVWLTAWLGKGAPLSQIMGSLLVCLREQSAAPADCRILTMWPLIRNSCSCGSGNSLQPLLGENTASAATNLCRGYLNPRGSDQARAPASSGLGERARKQAKRAPLVTGVLCIPAASFRPRTRRVPQCRGTGVLACRLKQHECKEHGSPAGGAKERLITIVNPGA